MYLNFPAIILTSLVACNSFCSSEMKGFSIGEEEVGRKEKLAAGKVNIMALILQVTSGTICFRPNRSTSAAQCTNNFSVDSL